MQRNPRSLHLGAPEAVKGDIRGDGRVSEDGRERGGGDVRGRDAVTADDLLPALP